MAENWKRRAEKAGISISKFVVERVEDSIRREEGEEAAGSSDGVYLFSRSSGTPLWSYQTGGGIYSVSISSDGSYVAAGNADCWVYFFSSKSQPTSLSVSPSSFTLLAGQTQTLTATLTAEGIPLPGKTVSWSATAGSLSATSSTTDSSGRAMVVYTAPSHATTVTITASFAGDAQYEGSHASSSRSVEPSPPSRIPFILLVVLIVAIVGAILALREIG